MSPISPPPSPPCLPVSVCTLSPSYYVALGVYMTIGSTLITDVPYSYILRDLHTCHKYWWHNLLCKHPLSRRTLGWVVFFAPTFLPFPQPLRPCTLLSHQPPPSPLLPHLRCAEPPVS